eukprot:Nk52_evm9s162 gene=Nk52_evmTU9s162
MTTSPEIETILLEHVKIHDGVDHPDPRLVTATVESIVLLFQKQQLTLLQLVESMSVYLTNSDSSLRKKGHKILTSVLSWSQLVTKKGLTELKLQNEKNREACNRSDVVLIDDEGDETEKKDEVLSMDFRIPMPEEDLGLFVTFFEGKISDLFIFDSVLTVFCYFTSEGFIFKSENLSPKQIAKLNDPGKIAEFFLTPTNIQSQSLMESNRRMLYQIILNLTKAYPEEIKALNNDFPFHYIECMQGESKPKNLIIVFDTLKFIFDNFKVEEFSDEIFSVTSCYFPVSFNPGPNDNSGVTAKDLEERLDGLLLASPALAQMLISLVLEKLSSSVVATKITSLKLFSKMCAVYEKKEFVSFAEDIWTTFRNLVFDAHDGSNLEVEALATFTKFCRAIQGKEVDADSVPSEMELGNEQDVLFVIFTKLFSETKPHFNLIDFKLAFPACKLLAAFGESSPAACSKVIGEYVPVLRDLVESLSKPQDDSKRGYFIKFLNVFIVLGKKYSSLCKDNGEKQGLNPLKPHRKEVLEILVSVLVGSTKPATMASTVSLLSELQSVEGVCREQDIEILSGHYLNFVLGEHDNSVKFESLKALSNVAKILPFLLVDTIVPRLSQAVYSSHDKEEQSFLLNIMATVSIVPEVYRATIPIMLRFFRRDFENTISVVNALKIIFEQNIDDDGTVDENNPDDFGFGAPDLFMLADETNEITDYFLCSVMPLLWKFYCNVDFMAGQIQLTYSDFMDSESNLNENTPEEEMRALSTLFKLFCLKAPPSAQRTLLARSCVLFVEYTSDGFNYNLLNLLCTICCSCGGSVPFADVDVVLGKLVEISLKQDFQDEMDCGNSDNVKHYSRRHYAARCVAGIVNKLKKKNSPNFKVSDFVDSIVNTRVLSVLDNEKSTKIEKVSALVTLLWVSKAILLRGHRASQGLVGKVIGLIEDDVVGDWAASGVSLLLADDPDILNPGVFANCKLLYKQKFFVENIKVLLNGFEKFENDKNGQKLKSRYTKAISYVLQNVPQQVLSSELPSLMPFLLDCLKPDKANDLVNAIVMPVLRLLYNLCLEAREIMSYYPKDLIPLCLYVCKNSKDMNCRCEALKVLGAIASLPKDSVLSYKDSVTRALGAILDDHKRIVRQECAKCRDEWFLLQ